MIRRIAWRLNLVRYCERCDYSQVQARDLGLPPASPDVVMPHWRHVGPSVHQRPARWFPFTYWQDPRYRPGKTGGDDA